VKAVCEALGVARSNVVRLRSKPAEQVDRRRLAKDPKADAVVLEEIRRAIDAQPSYGYPRVWGLIRNDRLKAQAPRVNRKRIHRLMKENQLLLAQRIRCRNDTRAHDGRVSVDESNLRWCSDGFEIGCWNKEKVRVAFALDCCDREAISWVGTTKGIDAGLVKDMMLAAVEQRFGSDATPPRPIEWLTDNGSCYTARETRAFARTINMRPLTTPVESPQSNGMAESFVKTIKRDYVAFGDLSDAKTVMAQLPSWFAHYNTVHPHSALKYMSPRMFREHQLTNATCPETKD
jgi:putative transposase